MNDNNNLEIRLEVVSSGIKYYQIAQKLGMQESNFSTMIRKPLTEENRNRIMEAIEELKSERGELH